LSGAERKCWKTGGLKMRFLRDLSSSRFVAEKLFFLLPFFLFFRLSLMR
jgi:hypothetical protein